MKTIETRRLAAIVVVVALLAFPDLALAQADEIQVYTGGLAPMGTFNLTLHNNYTPEAGRFPPFRCGGLDRSLNGVPEWALA